MALDLLSIRVGVSMSRLLNSIALGLLSIPVYTHGVSSRCSDINQELELLRKAQNQIVTSLARNHDVFADQLADLSFELSIYKKTVPPKALVAMEKSSEAYRKRAQKAFESADKLDASTSDLIKRIQSCLK